MKKNKHAAALGKLGGSAGRGASKARTAEQARAAAQARWGTRPQIQITIRPDGPKWWEWNATRDGIWIGGGNDRTQKDAKKSAAAFVFANTKLTHD